MLFGNSPRANRPPPRSDGFRSPLPATRRLLTALAAFAAFALLQPDLAVPPNPATARSQ